MKRPIASGANLFSFFFVLFHIIPLEPPVEIMRSRVNKFRTPLSKFSYSKISLRFNRDDFCRRCNFFFFFFPFFFILSARPLYLSRISGLDTGPLRVSLSRTRTDEIDTCQWSRYLANTRPYSSFPYRSTCQAGKDILGSHSQYSIGFSGRFAYSSPP